MLAAPDLVDPASIEVRPYQGRFAVFANGKLLKADFATQPLAHMWLHRHLCGNGQIIGDPQTIIEWIGASDQSRSAYRCAGAAASVRSQRRPRESKVCQGNFLLVHASNATTFGSALCRSVARRCSSSWSARWRSGNSAGGGDGLFTQPVHGDGSDDLRVPGADLVPALDPLGLVVSLQSRRDQRNHPVGDDLVAGGADMKRVKKDLALGGIEHIA